jgi:Protein kinase domain
LSFAIVEKSLVKDEAEMEGTLIELELELVLELGEVAEPAELDPPHAVRPDETKAAPATQLATLIDDFMHHSPCLPASLAGVPLTCGYFESASQGDGSALPLTGVRSTCWQVVGLVAGREDARRPDRQSGSMQQTTRPPVMSDVGGVGQSPGGAWSDTSTRLSSVSRGTPAITTESAYQGRPGRLVAGRYRLQRLLGAGGMGAVWLARDEVLVRPVAVKELTMPAAVLDRTAASAHVLDEARAASRVSHPGVVGVHDLAVEDGRHWIVMEALVGQTLAQAIREQGRLAPGPVLDIAWQLLHALRALHREGIVHRDVKPSNVQLSGKRVVLTDFGLASRCGAAPATTPGQVVGSPPFMAPETIEDGQFGPASDLFSLGATLYTAVEGCQPFDEASAFSTLKAVRHETPAPALHAAFLAPVIDGLLIKDPDLRLSLPQALSYLDAARSDLGATSRVSTQPRRKETLGAVQVACIAGAARCSAELLMPR